MINPWKLIGYVFLGLLAIGGIFAWNRHKDSQYAAALAKWEVQKKDADQKVKVSLDSSYAVGLQNAQSVPVYLAGKDRIITQYRDTPAGPGVQACFELADVRISACEKSRKADSVTIAALKADLKTTEAKPVPQLPRFQMYGAVGYSITVADKLTQAAPAIRAGIDTKLIGPVRLMTDGQLTMPGKGRSNPMWQANIMARVNF